MIKLVIDEILVFFNKIYHVYCQMHTSDFRENVNVLSFLGGQFCAHSTSSQGHRRQAGLMRGTANDYRWFILIFI